MSFWKQVWASRPWPLSLIRKRRVPLDPPLLAGCRGAAGQSGWYSSAEGEGQEMTIRPVIGTQQEMT